ncbi:MAG: hypothetical protein KBF47_07815 [Gemmatimonadales bacterium]|nr:hypothetical protein [Gemmatimonadales bacterium]
MRPGIGGRRLAGVLALGLVASGLAAQGPAARTGPSFVVARYSTAAATTLYAGYQVRRLVGFVGLVQHPSSGYREALAGVGVTVRGAGWSLLAGVAGASASDAWYAQGYLVPEVRVGRLELAATFEVYQPLEAAGAYQAGFTPLTALLRLAPGVDAGAAYLLSATRGAPDGHGIGPSLRVGVPSGSLRLDIVHGFGAAADEARLTLTTGF